jgi:RNA polymerase sigma-70 factor (ECF subfamily)
LFAAHHAALYRYISRFAGDPDLAEDVVQETFIRLAEHPPADATAIRAWLFTVATNLARDSLKIRGRRRRLLADREGWIPTAGPAPDPAEALERKEARGRVRRALAQLSEKERMLLLMREEGFKHREIAEALGTTTASVGTLIARALVKLAGSLGLTNPSEES